MLSGEDSLRRHGAPGQRGVFFAVVGPIRGGSLVDHVPAHLRAYKLGSRRSSKGPTHMSGQSAA